LSAVLSLRCLQKSSTPPTTPRWPLPPTAWSSPLSRSSVYSLCPRASRTKTSTFSLCLSMPPRNLARRLLSKRSDACQSRGGRPGPVAIANQVESLYFRLAIFIEQFPKRLEHRPKPRRPNQVIDVELIERRKHRPRIQLALIAGLAHRRNDHDIALNLSLGFS